MTITTMRNIGRRKHAALDFLEGKGISKWPVDEEVLGRGEKVEKKTPGGVLQALFYHHRSPD